ncbi:hypothetical protein CTheo_442 [Ceratobasidium theobromae]|uniref:Uncharacterized protein n=1 Tax=Ceratobasidium theobromae TaxID=1582974 RepID=A0A5N5QWP5_9AGAM|nr:hypothetical protein CTheo_442 [Ceratobasidium theobromae]
MHQTLCFWRKNAESPEGASGGNGQLGSTRGLSSNIEELSVAINQWSGRFEVVRGTQTYLFVDTLKAHSQRSDCFKEASVALYESCESLEFDLDARVKVAVHMALCELTTADQASLPLECKSLQARSSPKFVSQCSLGTQRTTLVELFGLPERDTYVRLTDDSTRSANHAKSIYANITSEKISLLSSLGGHHSQLTTRQQELAGLTQGLGSILIALEQYSLSLERSLADIPLKAGELANQIQDQVAVLLDVVLTDAREMNRDAFTNLGQQLAITISETRMSLASSTKSMQGDIAAVVSSLEAAALSWNSRVVAFNQRLDAMWDETFDRKLALECALDGMRNRIHEAGIQIELQLAATEKLQERSSEISTSIEHANDQIASVSIELSQELGGLVSITRELQSNLTQIPNLNSRWVPDILGPLSSIVNGKLLISIEVLYLKGLSNRYSVSDVASPARDACSWVEQAADVHMGDSLSRAT